MFKKNYKNYHTHTYRCHHAVGKDEDYVKTAIRNGYSVLGFSDHACWKYKSGYISGMRMKVEDFQDYKSSVLALKDKYKGKIDIYLGMEAEYFEDYMDDMLQFAAENDIDYLIFGNHYEKTDETGPYYGHTNHKHIQSYIDSTIAGLKTGMYSYLAHPDLIFKNRWLEWDGEIEDGFMQICKLCKELDIPLEYNVLGLQSNLAYGIEAYPQHEFWELAARMGNKAIIGMDAHNPKDLKSKWMKMAVNNLKELDIEVVDTIKFPDYKAMWAKRKKELEDKAK